MSKFDEKYNIYLASKSDKKDIMSFIDTEWKKGHILATNEKFFDYEFMEENGDVNFILARDRISNEIVGINGFLKASHNYDKLDVWGSILAVKDNAMGMLGVELISRRKKITSSRYDIGIGLNKNTGVKVHKVLLHEKCDTMKHFYILSQDVDFNIAKILINKTNPYEKNDDIKIKKVESIGDIDSYFFDVKNENAIPYKDEWYLEHRYYNHPIYCYEVYGIEIKSELVALFVIRKQEYKGHYAIRIVDYIGDERAISYTGLFWDEMLKDKSCEYIDFYNYGIDEEYLLKAGFILRDATDKNIIPNYFYPYVQENIDINITFPIDNVRFCKADGDQDRPN